jgi:hypothetical protein
MLHCVISAERDVGRLLRVVLEVPVGLQVERDICSEPSG